MPIKNKNFKGVYHSDSYREGNKKYYGGNLARERDYTFDDINTLLNEAPNKEAVKLQRLFSWFGKNDPDKLDEFVDIFVKTVGEEGYRDLEKIAYESGDTAYDAYANIFLELQYAASIAFGYNTDTLEDMSNFANWGDV